MDKIKLIFISGMNTDSSTGEFSQIKLFIESFDSSIEYKIFLKTTSKFQFNSLKNIIFYNDENMLIKHLKSLDYSIIILSEFQHASDTLIKFIYSINKIICTFDPANLSRKIYKIPENTICLKNCPLNNPVKNNTRYDKYWFFQEKKDNFIDKDILKKQFNIDDKSKLIFISIAPWQYNLSKLIGIEHYYKYLVNLLLTSLVNQDTYISLFIIYPIKEFHNIVIEKSKVKVLFFEWLDNQTYNNVLYNSDLVISDNITQVSMAKAFINGINTLSLINTNKNNTFKIFKFNMFPYNYDFLDDLYYLEYCQLINKAEVFDETQVMQKIRYLLSNTDNKHINYIQKCNNLKTPKQLIEEIILENIPSKM